MEQRCGVLSLKALKVSRVSGTPASLAMAGRWSEVFVDPPKAISTVMAFAKASAVMMSEGRRSRFTSSMICIPVSLARRIRSAQTAGMVPFPGSAIPRTSVRQFIELAVNIPAQEPTPGQAHPSASRSSSIVIAPILALPTYSKTLIRSIFFPWNSPVSIGPPLITMVGMSRRAAAMSIPGMILSQLGMRTRPSNG